MCLSTCTLSPLNTLLASQLSISLWKFISTKPTGQGFVTVHWFYWSSGEDSGLSLPYPDFNSWLRNQSPASNHCGLWPPKFKDTATSQQSATWKTVLVSPRRRCSRAPYWSSCPPSRTSRGRGLRSRAGWRDGFLDGVTGESRAHTHALTRSCAHTHTAWPHGDGWSPRQPYP